MKLGMAAVVLAMLGCSSGDRSGCEAAGGACVLGPAQQNCRGTVDARFDCNPERNPGGAVCCIPCKSGQHVVDGGCVDIPPPG